MSRLSVSLAALMVAVAPLSACGSGGADDDGFTKQSATKMVDVAEVDTKKATSVRLAGTIEDDGQRIKMNMAVSKSGDCKGSMTMVGKGSVQLLAVGGKTYMKPDEKFWRAFAGKQADQVMQMVGRKWADLGDKGFDEFCDLDQLLEDESKDDGKVTKGKTGSVNGTDAIELIQVDGKDETHVWIATGSPHYLLKMCKVKPKNEGCMTLSDYNKPVGAKAPAAGDIAKLG